MNPIRPTKPMKEGQIYLDSLIFGSFWLDPMMRWKFSLKSRLEVVVFVSIPWLSHRSNKKSTDSAKIQRRSSCWNSLRLRQTQQLSIGDRFDSTRGCPQSVASHSTFHPMWEGWFQVGHKPNPNQPVNTPTWPYPKCYLAIHQNIYKVPQILLRIIITNWRACT